MSCLTGIAIPNSIEPQNPIRIAAAMVRR
jgi:hypothetical protein